MGPNSENCKWSYLIFMILFKIALQCGHSSCVEILCFHDESTEEVEERYPSLSEEEKKKHGAIFGALTKEFLEIRNSRVEAARQAEINEQHIFTSGSVKVALVPPPSISAPLPALSKFVEYPGDPIQIAALLSEGKVNPGGKDMLGYSALHKFVSWDKVDLLELLCPHLSPSQIMLPAGGVSDPNQYSCLHLCIEMRAWRALSYLTSDLNVERFKIYLEVRDKRNRTFRDLLRDAVSRGEIQMDEVDFFL
jgi:hypothetical protein